MISVALTGHRHERLGYPELLPQKDTCDISPEWRQVVEWLKGKIAEFGITDAYCGMADGCDLVYGIAVSELKDEYKYPIRLHCILPCKNYNSKNYWYTSLKNTADEWVELSDEFYKGCDSVRDQYMIDHSDKLIAIWDGNKSGGVWSTIRKAQKKGIEIIYYPKEDL